MSATAIGIFSLVSLHYAEKIHRKDSYRTIMIRTVQHVDVSKVIEVIRRKNVRIVYCDYELDYKKDSMTIKLSLCLFHRGTTDQLSNEIIRDLENSKLSLKAINSSNQ